MLKIMLIGGGRMGKAVAECIEESRDAALVQCVRSGEQPFVESDVLIDFSAPEAIKKVCDYCAANFIPAVIATTGYSAEQYKSIVQLSKKVPVFYSQNMSIGMTAVYSAVKRLSLTLKDCDIDIIEKHHRAKADAPSGTALMLAEGMAHDRRLSINTAGGKRGENQINILSLRAGAAPGEHEVIFNLDNECIIIKHVAYSRRIFAMGALSAARFIIEKPPGLYTIGDL